MKFPFDDIPEELKMPTSDLVGKQVYMTINDSAMSINDLVIATIDAVISTNKDTHGVVIKATQHYTNKNLEEELIERQGHAIYLLTGNNKVLTSNGEKMVISQCDDFGPYIELMDKEELVGKYYANAVFRYRGIFFFFKITGNYLFDDEESLIKCIEELDALKAKITKNGIVIKLFGEEFLITEYQMSINKQIYMKQRHKRMAYEAICNNEGLDIEVNNFIKLNFRRYILKYL